MRLQPKFLRMAWPDYTSHEAGRLGPMGIIDRDEVYVALLPWAAKKAIARAMPSWTIAS